MNDPFPNAKSVLKAATLRVLQANLNDEAQGVVDSWAASNPKLVKKWEADGSLLSQAKEASNQAEEALSRAQRDGMNHLSPHEIYELYGGPTLNLG